MKLGVTLDILNQKDTPAFYADTLANRPAAGFTGRVFISTDTLDLYRDTGTTWVLLSPSSTGTITGSGAAGQVTYFSAASSITGSNDLFFDSVNGHLGIGTITPSTALTIFHDQNQIIQINQTTATNDTKIAFQNNGTPLWRIGNSYNAGANDWGIFDVVGSIQPLTIKKTTGQTFIGSQTTSSGLLVVNSSTADNQIVAIGANSPSIRVRNAGTAPTQQFGLGLATATNNFIQGSASGDFCLFNGSTTASPILFGVYDAVAVSVQEAARVSAARNFLVGTTTDGGQKLQVNGGARTTGYFLDGMTAGSGALYWGSATNRVTLANYNAGGILNFEVNGGASAMTIDASGNLGLGITPNAWANSSKAIQISDASFWGLPTLDGYTSIGGNYFYNGNYVYIKTGQATDYYQYQGSHVWRNAPSGTAGNSITFTQAMTLNASGNLGLGVTPSAWGNSAIALQIRNGSIWNYNNSDNIIISSNNYFDVTNAAYKYVITGFASEYTQDQGKHIWKTAPSGTAGNTISFNAAMTLAATGNLLIGTTTDAGNKLEVNGSTNISSANFYRYDGNTGVIGSASSIDGVSVTSLGIRASNNIIFATNGGNERFRIRTNGVLNITNIPTSAVGLSSGDIYSNAGILTIVP